MSVINIKCSQDSLTEITIPEGVTSIENGAFKGCRSLKEITTYRNRLLDTIIDRHKTSVKMLTFLFEAKYSSDEIWNYLESYFLGIVPDEIAD